MGGRWNECGGAPSLNEITQQAANYVALHPDRADYTAEVFLDEERPRFRAECNLCNGRITNAELARDEAVINEVGDMWHRRCEKEDQEGADEKDAGSPKPSLVEFVKLSGAFCPDCMSPTFLCTVRAENIMKDPAARTFSICPSPRCPRKLVEPVRLGWRGGGKPARQRARDREPWQRGGG